MNVLAPRSKAAIAFRREDAPVLFARPLPQSDMSFTEIQCDEANFGATRPIAYEEAYLIGLQLRDCPDHELFLQGQPVHVTPIAPGVTLVHDLRRDPVAVLRSPFHSLYFHLSRKALDFIADDSEVPRIAELQCEAGACIQDPVIRQLIGCLAPALQRPDEASAPFVDHVALALGIHVAQTYGGMGQARRIPKGGLAPRHERRAKELLSQSVNGSIRLDQLAAECGLSIRHFARAFRQSTGMPPHRWLLQQRVEQAKGLLRQSAQSLVDIALACGFADQSHFTRVFTAMMGASPGYWRRMQLQ